MQSIATGSEIILLTWLHQARRDALRVHPRDDPENPLKGVGPTIKLTCLARTEGADAPETNVRVGSGAAPGSAGPPHPAEPSGLASTTV